MSCLLPACFDRGVFLAWLISIIICIKQVSKPISLNKKWQEVSVFSWLDVLDPFALLSLCEGLKETEFLGVPVLTGLVLCRVVRSSSSPSCRHGHIWEIYAASFEIRSISCHRVNIWFQILLLGPDVGNTAKCAVLIPMTVVLLGIEPSVALDIVWSVCSCPHICLLVSWDAQRILTVCVVMSSISSYLFVDWNQLLLLLIDFLPFFTWFLSIRIKISLSLPSYVDYVLLTAQYCWSLFIIWCCVTIFVWKLSRLCVGNRVNNKLLVDIMRNPCPV